ncbi:MAG: hypothetical protein MJK18_10100 [Bdellovibrionales bacterium]|nr:hypothetical protein [Bdellovibrionales bacterium]
MSKDNLILFPKKSNSIISMTENEVKWMISASLLVILTLAVGINSTLFAPSADNPQIQAGSRSIASVNPLVKVAWEKRAFEVLSETQTRDLAHVGKKPSAFDDLAFGALEGNYSIRLQQGTIAEINFASESNHKPKHIMERGAFVSSNLALFSKDSRTADRVHHEVGSESIHERFKLKNQSGQDLGVVDVVSDINNNLISMKVQ